MFSLLEQGAALKSWRLLIYLERERERRTCASIPLQKKLKMLGGLRRKTWRRGLASKLEIGWDFQGPGACEELTASSSSVNQYISIGSLPKTSSKWGTLVIATTRRSLWVQGCPLSLLAFYVTGSLGQLWFWELAVSYMKNAATAVAEQFCLVRWNRNLQTAWWENRDSTGSVLSK